MGRLVGFGIEFSVCVVHYLYAVVLFDYTVVFFGEHMCAMLSMRGAHCILELPLAVPAVMLCLLAVVCACLAIGMLMYAGRLYMFELFLNH